MYYVHCSCNESLKRFNENCRFFTLGLLRKYRQDAGRDRTCPDSSCKPGPLAYVTLRMRGQEKVDATLPQL